MTIATQLASKFTGHILEAPVTEKEIAVFEKHWKRSIPGSFRAFLLETNGVAFDCEVRHAEVPVICFMSLFGIDSALRACGDYAYSFIVPFSSSLTHGFFCLDGRESESPVYLYTPPQEYDFDMITLRKVSANLSQFVDELKEA